MGWGALPCIFLLGAKIKIIPHPPAPSPKERGSVELIISCGEFHQGGLPSLLERGWG